MMEEEPSDITLNKKQLDKLREQMKTRYDQALSELNVVDSDPAVPENTQLPQPGTWLTGLKRSATGSLKADDGADLSTAPTQALNREQDARARKDIPGAQPVPPMNPMANAPITPIPGAGTPPWNAQAMQRPVPVQPVPPRKSSGRFKPILIIVCLVLLVVAGISVLLQQMLPTLLQQRTSTNGATQTPTQVATQSPTLPPPVVISFEDGGLDGWIHSDQDGTITSIKNLSTSNAKDGSHVLQVTYNSDNGQSYPSLETSKLPKPLKAGQTITVYVLKTQGSNVTASLYVADQTNTWYKATTGNEIVQVNNAQTWYPVSFAIPSTIHGSIARVGIILFGYKAVVNIDAYSW